MTLARRGFLGALLATPAIIRTPGLLMAIRPPMPDYYRIEYPLVLRRYEYGVYVDETETALRQFWDSYKVDYSQNA